MAEQTDPSQPPETAESAEAKRSVVDTLAEQQALAALDELIAKVDSGPELSGAQVRHERQEPPPDAFALTGDVPPFDGWYVAMKDNAQGPLTVEDLKERWSRGEIGADTLCWREGMGEWRPLSRLHGLTAAIAPRPREGLKALSARPPVTGGVPVQSGYAARASKMLKSLAEQEVKTPPPEAKPVEEAKPKEAKPPEAPETERTSLPPPSTAPTTPEGPRRVRPPAARPAFSAEPSDLEDEDAPKRPAGVSGAKLFFSLFAASVLGGVVGGGLVRMTIPPPPEPEVISEPPPAAPPPAAPAAKPPAAAQAPAPPPPAPAKVEPKPEPKVEAKPKPEPKVEAKPKVEEEAPKVPPAPKKPPPPKDQLDKDFESTFGQ